MTTEKERGKDNSLNRLLSDMTAEKIEKIISLKDKGRTDEAQKEIDSLKPIVRLQMDLLIDQDQGEEI